ncbi:EKC/KEOPS complex subunit LAGE3 isoform X3 [Sceloporus undulatus]|uniref:EKC/KEOPS complex subunit LAGE3 isoform X3 n=1 Tax=Sceloporus undulatus TaxID=8520 RepID=UPI001C4C4E7D|nr:EKC/KEOPS complex subunit LAGE3 isoform X3 [Sceloporus undulatus]
MAAPGSSLALYPERTGRDHETGFPLEEGEPGGRNCRAPGLPFLHHKGRSVGELSIPFPSSLLARIALDSLAPDPEPRKGGISKELSVMEDTLHICWKADEARILRVSVNSFLEHLSLVVETMDLFGPPVV